MKFQSIQLSFTSFDCEKLSMRRGTEEWLFITVHHLDVIIYKRLLLGKSCCLASFQRAPSYEAGTLILKRVGDQAEKKFSFLLNDTSMPCQFASFQFNLFSAVYKKKLTDLHNLKKISDNFILWIFCT